VQNHHLKKWLKVGALLALPVMLFVLLSQLRPRIIDLGRFKNATEAHQKSFKTLAHEARRHPYALVIRVMWQGPLEQRYGGPASLTYDGRRKTLIYHHAIRDSSAEGGLSFVRVSCSRVNVSAVQRLTGRHDLEGELPKECHCQSLNWGKRTN